MSSCAFKSEDFTRITDLLSANHSAHSEDGGDFANLVEQTQVSYGLRYRVAVFWRGLCCWIVDYYCCLVDEWMAHHLEEVMV
jgi:hypothetical protein